MKSAKIRCEEGGQPGFQAIGEGEGCSLNRAMITSVVSKHERRNVNFPVQGGLINESREILGDSFVANFGLAVALGVVA